MEKGVGFVVAILVASALLTACDALQVPGGFAIPSEDSNTPVGSQSWQGDSFVDEFGFYSYNDNLWTAVNNFNGAPFGCRFLPANVVPERYALDSGELNLRLNSSSCAELKTKRQAAGPRSTVGGVLSVDDVPGTVASVFTFKRWDTGGGSWQEIGTEYLPAWPGAGSQPRLHVAIIYQASPIADKYIYEGFINVGRGFLSPDHRTPALFDWDTGSVQWKYGDQVIFTMREGNPGRESFSYAESDYTVYVYRNNAFGGRLNVPADHFPSDKTFIYMNYWRGDNSDGVSQFMGRYPASNPEAVAHYKSVFYTRW